MEYLFWAFMAVMAAIIIWYVGKCDPVIVIAWRCNECHQEIGRGWGFRRASIKKASQEHTRISPQCHGSLEPIEYTRHPFIP